MPDHPNRATRSTFSTSIQGSNGLASYGVPSRGLFIFELVLALLLTRIPYVSVPFKWLESYFHELSHGIATILSGGIVSHIQLFPNGAGFCFSQGGSTLLIGFSGYFGAACWGYIIYLLATWPRGIRVSSVLLGVLVVVSGVLWGRDILTLAILAVLTIIFLLPLKLSQNKILTQFLRIIGLMIMLNALASPTFLLGLDGQGDAALLAEHSWIPAWIWVGLWLLTSACALFFAWRRVDSAASR